MTPDMWTIIGTGIALAVLIFRLVAWVRSDMKALATDMKEGFRQLGERLLAVEEEQARTSGLLEGLGLTGRATPTPGAGAD